MSLAGGVVTGRGGDANGNDAVAERTEPTFEFVVGRACLDIVATVAERRTTALEQLQTPVDLQHWIEQAHLDRPPTVSSAQLAQARAVREALFAVVSAALENTTAPSSARDVLNAIVQRPGVVLRLGPAGGVGRRGDLEAVLADLMRDCFGLLSSQERTALSRCADDRCTRVFVDTSRGKRRRWCGMSGCGDRAEAAAYRPRRSGVSSS